jgi:hypothetical protein
MMSLVLFSFAAAAAAQESPTISAQESEKMANSCVRVEDRERPMTELSAAARNSILACVNRQAAESLNRQLPMQIDEMTILESVAAEGTLLTYSARITMTRAELPADAAELLGESTRRYVCGTTDMVETISYGGSYRYVWIDANGQPVHQLTILAC